MGSFFNPGFMDFLEESPRAGYQSFQGQFGDSPNQRRFFENQFQQLHNRFMGTLGEQIRGGQAPTARFATPDPMDANNQSFLQGGFPEQFAGFSNFYGAQPPSFAGRQTGNFSPRATFYF